MRIIRVTRPLVIGLVLAALGCALVFGWVRPEAAPRVSSWQDPFPLRVPAGSPDMMLEVNTEERALFAVINGRSLVTELFEENQFGIRKFGLLLPSDLIRSPGKLPLALRASPGAHRWDPLEIEVYLRKHDIRIEIDAPKTILSTQESFPLQFTITNRSDHAICIPRKIEPREYGGMFSVYFLNLKAPGSSVFYTPTLKGITAGVYLDSVETYLTGGLFVRIEPGGSYRSTVTGLNFADLMKKNRRSEGSGIPKGRYIVRAEYTGFSFPAHVHPHPTIVPADEMVYSNELEFMVQ